MLRLLWVFLLVNSPAFAQQLPREFNIKLTEAQLSYLWSLTDRAPWIEVNEIKLSIQRQIATQTAPPKPEDKPKEKSE
jgi:pantothenate kinase